MANLLKNNKKLIIRLYYSSVFITFAILKDIRHNYEIKYIQMQGRADFKGFVFDFQNGVGSERTH